MPLHDTEGRQDDNSSDTGFDALADIMLGLVAVVLLAVIVLIPVADFANTAQPQSHRRLMQDLQTTPVTLNGRPATPFVASRSGLVLPDGSAGPFDSRAIIDGGKLGALLEGIRDRDHAVLLFIEDGGHESAFHFEARLARTGHRRFAQVRVGADCGFATRRTAATPIEKATETAAARYCAATPQ